MLMMLLTPRLLVAVTVLFAVTAEMHRLKLRGKKIGIMWPSYEGGKENEQSTWKFLRSLPGKPNNLTRDLKPYEWLLFKQTDQLLKRWRLVATTRPILQDTILGGRAYGRVEPFFPVPPTMEPSTWNFDSYTTCFKQPEQSTWKFLGKTRRNCSSASCHEKRCEWLLFNQTDPLLKSWRLVATTRPVMINIQSVEVQQNLSEPDITPGEVRGQGEPTDTVPPMQQSTWKFLRSLPGKPNNLTRDLKPYEWLLFKQTDQLLKRWRLVATTRPILQDTILGGRAYGRVEPFFPVPPTMEPSTWNFDSYTTCFKQPEQSTWKFLGKTRRNCSSASCHEKRCEWLLFNQTDPLLKSWRLVATTRPVMINIQSVEVQQNLSEPDITPGEVRGQGEPTDTVPPEKEPSTWNFDDNASRSTRGTHSEQQDTWTFVRRYRGKSHKLTRDLKEYEWLVFNQTDPLLKRWRLVTTTALVPDTKPGEAHDGRVEKSDPVPPKMEPCTWNLDVNNTSCKYSESTWKILGRMRRTTDNDTCHDVMRYEWLLFNQTDPLLKSWRLVATTRPVMINIQSVEVQQNLSEPDITPREFRGQGGPTDTVPPEKIPEVEDTMENNHQDEILQIIKTGVVF